MNQDDNELLEALARGDRRALERIYRKYKDRTLTAAMHLLGGDRLAAEDVLHDVFVKFAANARVLKIEGSLRNYLITACLNRARDMLRQKRRIAVDSEALCECLASIADPSAAISHAEEAARLLSAVNVLPDKQREVLVLRVYGELTFREISESLEISINTAQSRYRYALAALRRRLQPDEARKGG